MAIYTSDHIGKWFWLKYNDTILLTEEFNTEISRSISGKKLIQGDAGIHVMSNNGKTRTSTFSSDILLEIPQPKYNINGPNPSIVNPPFNPGYKDLLDLLIADFNIIKSNLYNPESGLWFMTPRNLLTRASLQIGNTIRCTLNYEAYYDQMFNLVQFADVFPQNYDFLARVAKNYDCRFFATESEDQILRILSGSITISIDYSKIYLANIESEYPLYSPQGYEVSGSITVPVRNWNLFRDLFNSQFIKRTNFSLLVGNRYLRLGQTIIQDKMNITMNDNLMTAEITFKGYARL